MTKFNSAAVEAAAGRVLQGIAAERGRLLAIMESVGLGGKAADMPAFGGEPMSDEQRDRVTAQLRQRLPAQILEDVQRRTGVWGDALLDAVAQQLHLVRMFALSDGDSFEDNLRAVERLVVGGNVEMFAAA